VYFDNNVFVIGKTPEQADIQDLIEWLESKTYNDVFLYWFLPKIYPEAEKFKDVASGLLALSISKVPQNYILWFRPEVTQTVNWGRNPSEVVELEQDGSLRFRLANPLLYGKKRFN